MGSHASVKELHCYSLMRKRGAALYIPMPLCHLGNADDVKLKYTETKLIQFFHPKLNYPFFRKYQTDFDGMNSTTRVVRGGSSMSSTRRQKKRVNDLVKAFPNIIMEKDTHVDVKSRRVAMQLMCSTRKV